MKNHKLLSLNAMKELVLDSSVDIFYKRPSQAKSKFFVGLIYFEAQPVLNHIQTKDWKFEFLTLGNLILKN